MRVRNLGAIAALGVAVAGIAVWAAVAIAGQSTSGDAVGVEWQRFSPVTTQVEWQ